MKKIIGIPFLAVALLFTVACASGGSSGSVSVEAPGVSATGPTKAMSFATNGRGQTAEAYTTHDVSSKLDTTVEKGAVGAYVRTDSFVGEDIPE